MSKIKGFAAVLAAVAMVFVGNSAHADAPQLGWTAEHLTTDPSCIRTDGTLVYAYAAGNYTANGVHFSAISTSDFPCSDIGWTRSTLITGKSYTVSGVTGGYGDLLSHFWSINGSTQTITLNNLTAGRRYLVQIIGCNQSGSDHNTDVYVDGYESQLMRCGASAEGWPYGGTLIGVFDATDSTYSFDLKFADTHADWVAYNAIQVRDLTPVTYVVTKATDDSASPEEGSLRAAVAAAQNGDIVTFDSSLAGQTINLAAQIVVNKTVSIVGPSGRVTLSGGWNGSNSGSGGSGHGIFYVNASGRSVELSNLNLVNSYGVDDKSNRALYVPAVGSVTVTDCSFSNNYCTKNGGAVRLDTNAAYAKFVRCLFADNMTHNANGGAIYSEQAATAYLIVDGCSFRRNCAATSGSANGGASIFSTAYNSTLVVVNSEFSDGRTQQASGGAIKKLQGPLYVVNSTFRGNYIFGDSWGPAIDGRGPTYFVNCTFAGNMQGNANKGGGSLYLNNTRALVNSAFCYNWEGALAISDVIYNNRDIGSSFTTYFGTAAMRGVVGNGKKMVTTNGTQENLTLASTLADMSGSTKLFADYELRTSIVYPAASGVATVDLNANLFVPALLEDGSLARVVEIDPEGELVSGGSLVKVSADYLNCAFSEDGGATWTALYGDASLATELITADQRGVAYPVVEGVMQVPIGAACVTPTIAEKAAELEPGEWLVCPLTGDPSDIVTLGDLVVRNSKALAYSSVNITGDDSLAGLSFSNVEIGFDGDMKSDLWSNYRTDSLGNCGLDNGYGTLMANGWAGQNQAAARTIILDNLTVGKTYLIQGFVHDANHPDNQLTVGGGTITYGAASPSDRWYYGGTFVHVFTATATSYTIDLSYSLYGSLINGLQLREFPEPVDPDAGTVTAEVDDYDVTITLTDVVAGSDAHGLSLAPYNVWAALGDEDPVKVVTGASATTASFSYEDLDIGSYTCTVYIENSAGDLSEEEEVEFRVASPLPPVASDIWIAKPLTGADTDVINSGTTVYALTCDSNDPGQHQINGVDFDEITALGTSSEHVQTSVEFDDMSDKFGLEDFPDSPPHYSSMMRRAIYSETGSSDGRVAFTFSGLTAGDDYIVQLMVHANSSEFPKQLNRMYAPDGQWVRFGEPTGSGEWKYGGTIIGRFTATGTSQTFTFAYDPSGWMQINALQLRTAPKTVFVKTTADAYPTGPRDSLRAALAAVADGGRIVVDPALAGQTISLVGVNTAGADTSFVIDKSVTIEGNGVIIDGGWDGIMKSYAGGRIFTVPADVQKVTIRNLTMQNGHGRGWNATSAFYNGGAMGAFSPVRFENCKFIRNCSTDVEAYISGTRYGGGAIYSESDVEIVDCEFSNNVGGNGNSAYGGAICMNGGSLLIERTTASGDYAGSYGGGFFYGESMTSLVIRDSSFSGHCSANTAGGFWIKSCDSTLVERSRFADCRVPAGNGWGGAILLGPNTLNDQWCGKAVFRDCEFTDCSSDCGGAVRTKSNPTLFVNCTFTGCAVTGSGWGPAIDSRGNDYCVNCTFTGNMYAQSGNGNNGGYAVCRYGTACTFLNTVGTFNYYRSAASETSDLMTGRDFYDNNFVNTICNGKAADRTTDLTSDSVLFAQTAARSSINCWGTEVALRSGVIVPTLSALGDYPSRVVEIKEGGLLDGTGYPVKINDDYTWIQYSSDGGSTWTDFYKAATADGSTLALVAADQRGVAYPEVDGVMKAPIGATCVSVEPLPETPYEVTGNPKVFIDGGYVVYAWRDASQTGTLKIPSEYSSVRADYLVVGGGGAGGFCRGGGGGGGGVVYETVQDLASGTYAIIVGAGGVPDVWEKPSGAGDNPYKYSGSSTAGTDGGRSAITIEGTVVGEALGGGGGGTFITGQDSAYTQYGSSGAGRTGANAGGSANMAGSTAALDASGFAGGAAWSKDGASGGGGGAGANGVAASANDHSGNGGDGVECSITGESVFYGGGGGAGVYSGTAGVGGLGGGGNGGNVNTSPGCTAGVNGLGGGGGGASGAGNKWVATVGAPGGSGTVIIRLPLDPSSQTVPPSFKLATPIVDGRDVTITLNNIVLGTDSTGEAAATSYDIYAYTGDDPAVKYGEGLTAATATFTLEDQEPGAYAYNVYVVNNGGLQSQTAVAEFTIQPAVTPSATLATTVKGTDVTFNFSDIVIGTDTESRPADAYSILLAYAPQGEELPEPQVIVADQTSATYAKEVLDLDESTTYAYTAIVSNDLGNVSASITGTFTTGIYIETVNKLAQKLAAGEWVGVPMTGQPSDVVSYGEEVLGSDGKVRAYINGNLGTDATISFVNFRDGWNTTDLNMVFGSGHKDYGDAGTTGCYVGLMKWGWYGNNSGDDTYTLKNLVPGQSYLIQIIVHDGRTGKSGRNFGPGPGNIGNRIYFGEDTKETALPERGGVNWYYGGTLIHAFVATGTDYTFVINTASGSQQINAIQLRTIPMPKGSPMIGALTAAVEQGTAQVTLGSVVMGTDDDAQPATSYDVYASIDDAEFGKVLDDQTSAPVSFLISDLAVGEHDIKVFIENNFGAVSETNSVEVTVVTADPACYFPDGNWVGMPMSKDAHEIRLLGETVYALATSAGNNGRLYTVNGLKYHDTQRNNASWGDWQLVNWADFSPAFTADKDSFGGEDVPTISNEDMAFQTVCKRGWLSENGSRTTTDFTMTLKQLETGVRYVVQMTAHNGSDNYGGKSQTMTAPDGVATITLGDADTTGTWRYGGTLIGTFVASNTTHAFKFTYGSDPRFFQLNSIQLRKMSSAPTVVPAYPTLGNTSVFVGRGSATLTVGGLDAGVAGDACDIYYALAEEGQALGAYTLGATGVTDESCTFALPAVAERKSYVYSVYAVNPATKLASEKVGGSFTIEKSPGVPDEMTVEPVIRPGLVQAKFGAGVLFDSQIQPPLVSNLLTQADYASSLDFTYGALMANHNCADESAKVLNTYTATQWNWDNTNTVFAYEGEIYLQKGQRLVIFGRFDDGEAAVVDGVTLLAQGNGSGYNNEPATRWVVYEPAESGWYPLNAWVWDYTGGKNVMIPPSALAYNLAGVTGLNDQNRSQWKHLEDTDGKGSFLRFKEAKTLMTLAKPVANGVDVTVNAAFTDLPYDAKFVAYVSMSHDGGLDPLAWDDVVKIADIAAGDTAAADYVVKGLASYPFVRFAIESEGSISTAERCRNFRQMSCAVGFGSDGLSLIVTDPVFAKTNGTFNVIVADTGAVTPLSLNVEVSSDPAFGSTVYQGTIDGIVYPGRFPVAINGLTPGTTYYVRVKPTTAGDDAWVVSAPIETEVFGNLCINEIMASNGDTFKTKSGRSGLDWIEIYNGTDEEVDLAGWYLYDDPSKAQSKWKKIQGACVIPVHGYGIVWCDKDYTGWDAANEAWSEIGLSTSGETVFLAKPDGTVVDTVTFGTQMKEISYGVGKLPGSDEATHVFFKVTTPGTENGEYGYGPMTPAVAFTVPHGYKTAPIDVAITCETDPDADIYYTLDGTQPTTASTKYTAPIHIDSTTILRAGVPQENTVLQIDSSATYIYLDDILTMDRMGDGSATTEARNAAPSGFPLTQTVNNHTMRYGMLQSIVNGPDRDRVLRGFTNTVATLSIVMDPELLFGSEDGIYVNSRKYMADGAAGERPMLLEQIDPVNGAANEFSVPGGLRLRGSSSLAESNPKHSLRFFFRGQYGMSKLEFPLFGEEGADSFSKVDLRCSQNYSWSKDNSDCETFIHELFSRDSQRDLGQLYTRTRYYNLFINGQYWGLYMTQERGDKDFAETYAGGNEDYYDCIKTSSVNSWASGYQTTANDGTIDAWRNLQGLAYNGFADGYVDNYNRALGLNPDGSRNEAYPILLNPENLMAFVSIAHFVCDADGPVSVGNGGLNNLYANRCQIDGMSSVDGFWFLRHDAEHSMGVSNLNELTFAPWTQYTVDNTGLGTHEYNPLNPDWSKNYRGEEPPKENRSTWSFGPYELHAQLEKNPVYNRAFADYFYKHYLKEGGAMTPAVAKQRFEARMAEIDDVVVSEAARWSMYPNRPKSREAWLAACSNCLDFIDHRTPYLKTAYQGRGWYPMINPPQPDVPAGVTTNDTVVTFTVKDDEGVTVDDCEVYITTDGSDPAESANASATITLATLPMTLNVRAKKNGEWSALETVAYQPAIAGGDGYTFVFEGSFEGDQTIAPTGSECVVIFNNATIDGTFTLPDNVKVYLCPSNGTENSVSSIIGPNANLTLRDPDGLGGSVSLEGGDTLISISNLVVKSGVLNLVSTGVSATKTPIVNVLGHVKQDGGVINLDSSAVSDDPAMQSYGIYVANKDPEGADGKNLEIIYAEFNGGEFNAKVGGWKSAALYINKGSVEATFNEGSTNHVELVGPEARFVNASGDLNLKGGEFDVTMPVDCTSITNARVFKSDKEIKIKGGHYDVNVPGPGAEIFSAVKDKKDSIITVKDGTFELVADDDCFSADDRIDIQGGLFYAVSLNNDVFDSNGDMLISGGTIMAYATATGHEAFDVEPMVQGTEVSTFLPHQLTISGGTIFATGGKDAAWPENTVAGTGVNLYKVTGVDADGISEMYASIQGSQQIEGTEDTYDVTTTAKLPAFAKKKNGNALLMTCPNMADGAVPTFSDVAPTEGSQDFHDLYISSNLPSNHEYVRMYEIYGSTNDGAGGDTGEYIILTNVSDKVVQLAGLNVTSAKYDKKKDKIETPKVNITLTEGTLAAGASIKLEQSDFTDKGWEKITNGTIYFQIIDDKGTVVQSGFGAFDDELFPKTDGGGAAIRAKRFDNETELAATVDDWGSTAKAVSGLMFYVW